MAWLHTTVPKIRSGNKLIGGGRCSLGSFQVLIDNSISMGKVKPNRILGRVLIYKNLIYLLNLQFYCVHTSYPMDNC